MKDPNQYAREELARMQDSPPATSLQPLNCDRDPARWAREFNAVCKTLLGCELDEGWLISWFANAMMCGEDTYRWRQEAKGTLSASKPVENSDWLEIDDAYAAALEYACTCGQGEQGEIHCPHCNRWERARSMLKDALLANTSSTGGHKP